MKKPGNSSLAAALAALFGSNANSDCVLQFVLEPLLNRPSKRAKLADELAAAPAESPDLDDKLGEPLHGHTLVLRYASDWFRAKLDDLQRKEEQAASLGDGAAASTKPSRPHPVLRVPLGSAEEVPSARAAIQFAYMGELQAGTIREALEVLRQAGYLQIHGCAAACAEVVKAKLTESQGRGEAGGGSDSVPPVLEFYACEAYWVDSCQEPTFADILTAAKLLLVRYFGDTLSVLNSPPRLQQLLALPAVAVEALLESDNFGADTEDSVLLLLATWMKENFERTDVNARRKLCRLVRLAQLGTTYATVILPALAADFAATRRSPADKKAPGWFPIRVIEAALFGRSASAASEREYQRVLKAAESMFTGKRGASSWYNTTPRRQCVPEDGMGFDGCVSKQELVRALGDLSRSSVKASCTLESGSSHVIARGFNWRAGIKYYPGGESGAAGLYLECSLPPAYKLHGSELSGRFTAVVGIHARLDVFRYQGGAGLEVAATAFYLLAEDLITAGIRKGIACVEHDVLQLDRQAAGEDGRQLGAWAAYLHGDRIAFKLTLLPGDGGDEDNEEDVSSDSDTDEGEDDE